MAVRPLIVATLDALIGLPFAARLALCGAQSLGVRLYIRDCVGRWLTAIAHRRSRLDGITTGPLRLIWPSLPHEGYLRSMPTDWPACPMPSVHDGWEPL